MSDTTEPSAEDVAWVRDALAAIPPAPVRRSARSPGVDPLRTFAASVRQQLHKRDRRIEALEGEVRQLRDRLDTHERLAEVMQRLDRLEGQRSHLRVAT